jgi:hypothetical protein
MDQLFSTLAYQLATNTAGIRQHVEEAMTADPALPMKSAATQLQKLIIDPFNLLPTPSPSPILIIEGLNECDQEFQDALPVLISKVLLDPTVRIRFIVSGLSDYQYESMCRNCLVLGRIVLVRVQLPFSYERYGYYISVKAGTAFFFFLRRSDSGPRQ